MNSGQYHKGLKDLGNGVYAYLQPDGSWGWSNAGLICDGDQSLLVDTLFDLNLTRDMLEAMRAATPAANNIRSLVNTHANGDHCWGNQLVEGADIVASKAAAEEMAEVPPQMLAQMMAGAAAGAMGPLGDYILKVFGSFSFDDITAVPPTTTFEGELERRVGDKRVMLYEVGPAHTRGDVIALVPDDRVVFTGDILFVEGHPIIWAGPVGNWIKACQRIIKMDVEAVVPGHGPITDKAGVAEVQGYLEYISAEARKRYDAGLPAAEAARDIALDDYSSWGDSERIVVNVSTLYREFAGNQAAADIVALFTEMSALAHERGLHGLGQG